MLYIKIKVIPLKDRIELEKPVSIKNCKSVFSILAYLARAFNAKAQHFYARWTGSTLLQYSNQGRRIWEGRVDNCPPSFWQTNSIKNILVAILGFPIYCLPTQILNASYASALKNKPPMVVTVHKLKPMEFFCLLGYSMIYIWIGNSKGHCLNNAKYFFTKLAILIMIIQIHKTALIQFIFS